VTAGVPRADGREPEPPAEPGGARAAAGNVAPEATDAEPRTSTGSAPIRADHPAGAAGSRLSGSGADHAAGSGAAEPRTSTGSPPIRADHPAGAAGSRLSGSGADHAAGSGAAEPRTSTGSPLIRADSPAGAAGSRLSGSGADHAAGSGDAPVPTRPLIIRKRGRRVTTDPVPGYTGGPEPEPQQPASENDARLKGDVPPHWG
jgi:hypothetical protein